MNLKEIKELIETLIEKDITEFELERGNEKIRIRRGTPNGVPQMTLSPAAPLALAAPAPLAAAPVLTPAAPQAPLPTPVDELHIVKSPIVGTF